MENYIIPLVVKRLKVREQRNVMAKMTETDPTGMLTFHTCTL